MSVTSAVEPGSDLEPATTADPIRFGRRTFTADLTPLDLVASLVALLLCVAYGSAFLVPSWTPRMIVLLAVLPLGAALLFRQSYRRDPIALVAVGVVAWAIVAGLLNGHARQSLFGSVGTEESTLILLAALGLLALGRELSGAGRVMVGWTVVAGVGLSSAVGLLQYLVQTDSGTFALSAGRASGLTPWPVYFGVCAAGAFGIVIGRHFQSTRATAVASALACWFGMAISLSGTRIALLAAITVAVFQLAVQRNRHVVAVAAGMVVGVGVGTLLTMSAGNGGNAVSRANDGGSGRVQGWRYGLDALRERPVFGWGFGYFRRAVQGRFDVAFARQTQGGNDQWFDAHNAVIGVGVSLGIVGIVMLLVLTVMIARAARGPLACGAVALAMSWLLEPMGLATFPVALLLLGAALPAVAPRVVTAADDADTPERSSEGKLLLLLVPGLILALIVGGTDLVVQRHLTRGESDAAAAVVDALPADSVLAGAVGYSYLQDARSGDPVAKAKALEWSARATAREPGTTRWWIRRAEAQATLDDLDGALASLDRARALEPNSWLVVALQMEFLTQRKDTKAVAALMPLACQLGVPGCTTSGS